MSYNPNIAPKNMDEWNQLINYKVAEEQERYNNEIKQAKKIAKAQWDKTLEQRIQAIKENNPNANIDSELEKEKEQFINDFISVIEIPQTKEQIEQTLSFLKPMEMSVPDIPQYNIKDKIINLNNNYWSIAEGRFIDSDNIPAGKLIFIGGEQTFEALQEFVNAEHLGDPSIPKCTDKAITDKKFDLLREARKTRFALYDAKINQLNREVRQNPAREAVYMDEMQLWDNYARLLSNITELPNAPWDGGGEETPWPEIPSV